MQKRVAEFWYGIETQDDGIVHLREAWIDPYLAGDMWLVRGSRRDVLIDTGTGIVSPEPIVKAVTGRSVLAIACNAYYDHAGGLHWFGERGCHHLEAPSIESPTLDSSLVSVYVDKNMFMAYPDPEFSPARYRMQGSKPTIQFEHGEQIDLGDRTLQILSVPGMTAGSIALWEAQSGSLFTCDTLFDDPLERPFRPDDAAAFTESLRMLKQLPVKDVYGGHYGRFSKSRMLQIIDRYFAAEGRSYHKD